MMNVACSHGFFGQDCADGINDTCDRCNNINGSCDSGCNPGWQGLECQGGNLEMLYLYKKHTV